MTPSDLLEKAASTAQQGLNIYYDRADQPIDRTPLLNKNVAVLGFGSQGYGQSMNLKASGAKLKIALRSGSSTEAKVKAAGIDVIALEDVAQWADVLVFLIPDQHHKAVYTQYLQGKLRPGQTLLFSHGFSIHYGQIVPPENVNVVMVAPKGPGHLVNAEFKRDRGVPCLMAVHQDANGQAKAEALAYATCIGGGRAGIIETNFKNETETDLFGEQAVLCGGTTALVQAGFETLVEAGYPPELAYFECLHELKLIVDLLYEGGIEDMRYSISDTARYGDVTRGPRVVTAAVKAAMKTILDEIQNGSFAQEFIAENEAGQPKLKALCEKTRQHRIEETGRRLRGMMSWLKDGKIIDRQRN